MAFSRQVVRDAAQVSFNAQLRGFLYLRRSPGSKIEFYKENPFPGDVNRFVECGYVKIGGDHSIGLIAAAIESGQVFTFAPVTDDAMTQRSL